jgi:hypothetical protein
MIFSFKFLVINKNFKPNFTDYQNGQTPNTGYTY